MAAYDNILSFQQPDMSILNTPGMGSIADVDAYNRIAGLTDIGTNGGGLFGGGGALGTGMNGFQLGNLALSGLGTIGGLIGSLGSLSLAKKQFNMQKSFGETNLNNQIKAYNTSLDDKARSRAVVEGQSDAERDAYIEENKATRS